MSSFLYIGFSVVTQDKDFAYYYWTILIIRLILIGQQKLGYPKFPFSLLD